MPFPNPESQFAPGQSGNPGGRPKGRSITALIRELLDAPASDRNGSPIVGKTVGDQVAEALLREARSGDVRAIKELLDRTEGRTRVAEPEGLGANAVDAWQELHDELNHDG